MTTRYKLILALLLLLILGSIITYRNNHNDAQEPAKATTTPSENSATTKNEDIPSTAGSTAVLAHINRETQTPFVSITPLEVLEDSRCPGNAVCIQMGTVKLSARITDGMGSSTVTFMLHTPVTSETTEITLESVQPAPLAGEIITPEEYEFYFTVKQRTL